MNIYHLRDSELTPELAAQLAPFIAAYRPLDRGPDKCDLEYEVERATCGMRDILETYNALCEAEEG